MTSTKHGIYINGNASNALQSAIEAHPACALVNSQNASWEWRTKPQTAEALAEAAALGSKLIIPANFGASVAELQTLQETAERNNASIVGHAPLRTSPAIQWLANQLQTGNLGRICMVEWNLFLKAKPTRQHPLNGLLYPYLDLQQWLFGPVSGLNATFADEQKSNEIEPAGLISYRIDTQGIGLIAYTTQLWQQSMETSLVLLGEKASIKIGGTQLDQLEYCQGLDVPESALATASPEACTINWMASNNLNNAFGIKDALETRALIERIYALRNEQHVRKTA